MPEPDSNVAVVDRVQVPRHSHKMVDITLWFPSSNLWGILKPVT
jgi:hypothetical protein